MVARLRTRLNKPSHSAPSTWYTWAGVTFAFVTAGAALAYDTTLVVVCFAAEGHSAGFFVTAWPMFLHRNSSVAAACLCKDLPVCWRYALPWWQLQAARDSPERLGRVARGALQVVPRLLVAVTFMTSPPSHLRCPWAGTPSIGARLAALPCQRHVPLPSLASERLLRLRGGPQQACGECSPSQYGTILSKSFDSGHDPILLLNGCS